MSIKASNNQKFCITEHQDSIALQVQKKYGIFVVRQSTWQTLWLYFTTDPIFYVYVEKIVTQLVEATNRLEVTNANALEMTVSTLGAVAATSSDMRQSAQLQLSLVIQNVIDNFQKASQTSSKEDSIAVGTIVLASFFDLLTVSQHA